MSDSVDKKRKSKVLSHHPFRRAVLGGMGVVLPPLLTIVIFLWVWGTVDNYVLEPIKSGARSVLMWQFADIRNLDDYTHDELKAEGFLPAIKLEPLGQQIPASVLALVRADSLESGEEMPVSAIAIYKQYIDLRYLQPHVVIPMFLAAFILLMYLLGKLLAAGVGNFFFRLFENAVHRLPVVRNVYGSVKQVTDFMFSESEIEYNRVVAIEYPRKGIWSLGMVTGESLLDIHIASGEPMLSVLIPTSPMPVTGYTINIRKSETIDLNLSVDEAFQFIVSCGVAVVGHQKPSAENIRARLAGTSVEKVQIQHPTAADEHSPSEGSSS